LPGQESTALRKRTRKFGNHSLGRTLDLEQRIKVSTPNGRASSVRILVSPLPADSPGRMRLALRLDRTHLGVNVEHLSRCGRSRTAGRIEPPAGCRTLRTPLLRLRLRSFCQKLYSARRRPDHPGARRHLSGT